MNHSNRAAPTDEQAQLAQIVLDMPNIRPQLGEAAEETLIAYLKADLRAPVVAGYVTSSGSLKLGGQTALWNSSY